MLNKKGLTPHINAHAGEFAKTVLMPGDPLRAKFIAETYLKDYQLVTDVRGMLGYTGYYKGVKVSVMGHGMGIPSVGIYSYELFDKYNVDNIIRVGSCGAMVNELNLFDVFFGDEAYSESHYAENLLNEKVHTLSASKVLLEEAKKAAKKLNKKYTVGTCYSADNFYTSSLDVQLSTVQEHNCQVVEMEGLGMYANAKKLGKNALVILTVSDHLLKKEETTHDQRRTAFTDMMEIALNVAVQMENK